jgi:dimethylglycine dehydrogenase
VPAFGEVGIKKVYNGAIAYTPDGSRSSARPGT